VRVGEKSDVQILNLALCTVEITDFTY